MDELPSWSVCSVLHGTKSTPTTCPPNKTPTPATTMVKSSLFRPMTKQFTLWHHHPPWHHLLAPGGTNLFLGASIKGTKGGPSSAWLYRWPPCHPLAHLLHLDILGGMPNSSALPDSRSCPSQKRFSSSSIIHCGIGSYHSLGSLKTLYPPWQKWSLRLPLRVPSMVADLNLFKEEISWKGEVGGNIRPLKAMVIWVMVMRPATPPSPLPQPTMGHHNSGTCGGQARPSGQLARMGDKVRQPQGWLHGQLRVAKKPQQEYGQGAAGMLQECQGWVKRPQEWPQARQKWAWGSC